MRIVNMEFLKRINRELVLDTIRSEQPISRAQVAQKLNLSRSSVSTIVDRLIEKNFVSETGLGTSTKEGGRRGMELQFNPKSGFGVGIEIHQNSMLVCITDLDGDIILLERFGAWNGYRAACDLFLDCLEKSSTPIEKVIAIGFCVPGLTNSVAGTVIDAAELGWNNVPFLNEISKYITKPVYINNDVNCEALAERWLGVTKNVDDFVYISIGTGVGSAIFANGSLVQGKNFTAGEIGYFALEEDYQQEPRKEINQVGDFGVFERKISKQSLSRHGSSISAIFQEFEAGVETSVKVVEDFVHYLSLGIANIVSLLNPEKVIIGGEVGMLLQPVLSHIQSAVAETTPIETTIQISTIGEEAGAFGIIAYAFEQVKDLSL
jgi:glucokinase